MELIIVESPTKAKTLERFLGEDFKITSSQGHIRDLPSKKLGIDIENNFEPNYVIISKAKKRIKELKKKSEKSEKVILATDTDREGEAISWHLSKALGLDKKEYKRIAFHEITKSAINEALEDPRGIDMDLVNAQQARRVLDRIVGYKLSPFLWKKIARGLSAGRVQSVALRFIVDREKEIKAFTPEEYWRIKALLAQKDQKENFEALLIKENGKKIKQKSIDSKEKADKIIEKLEKEDYKVKDVKRKEKKRNPYPPFTTSDLQQEAWQQYNFPTSFTMSLAQKLYEKGLITYHRTDSLNLSKQSLAAAKKLITEEYGENYHKWRKYKTKGRAQEAHEAIRPSYPSKTPEKVKIDNNAQQKLYNLIWRRFISSQMKPAIYNTVTVNIEAGDYFLRAKGKNLKFDGFLKVYTFRRRKKQSTLPNVKKEEELDLEEILSKQHFTQAPPRYSEASLIKKLKKHGIGRPSTYAPILSTIQRRNYLRKNNNKRFEPTEIGIVVNDLLAEHFPKIVDAEFTADMENELDKVANGDAKWKEVIADFYKPFSENLEKKYEEVNKKDYTEKPTDKTCPKCGAPLIIRLGKYGRFYACSNFPKCKYSEPLEDNQAKIDCPECEKGKVVQKKTRKGKIFYGCDQYPDCEFALWDRPTGEKCPKCGSLLVDNSKGMIKCSNKDCDFKKIDQDEEK